MSTKARYVTNNYDDYLYMIDELKRRGYFIYDTEIETAEYDTDTIEGMNTVLTGIHKEPEAKYVIKFLK